MFQDSLLEKSATNRRANSLKTAEFIGTAARAETEKGLETSMAKVVGEMLKAISKLLPGGYRKAADITGSLLVSSAHQDHTQWTRYAVDVLMRRVYESVHARPQGKDDAPAVRTYNNEYIDWQAEPEAAYVEALTEGSRP